MVNHRNISAGESRWRVQLASLSLGDIKQHLSHFHHYVDHRLKLGLAQNIALAKHLRVVESIYDQKTPNLKQIDTQCFLTDSGRICHVK